jgi:NAD(P) transhydrogenase subunit alpha
VPAPSEQGAETKGGYAREMDEAYKRRQADVLHEHLKKQDIVIATALIPGRPAPVIVTEAMVNDMKPGAVIVDLAVEAGGNCALSELGKTVERNGVRIIGYPNVPSRIATDSSALYARNLVSLLALLVDAKTGALKADWNDEILKAIVLTREGRIVHPQFGGGS